MVAGINPIEIPPTASPIGRYPPSQAYLGFGEALLTTSGPHPGLIGETLCVACMTPFGLSFSMMDLGLLGLKASAEALRTL